METTLLFSAMAGSPLAAASAVHVALIPEAYEIDEDTPILRFFNDCHNLADEDCRILTVSPRVCHNCGGVIAPCPEHMGGQPVGPVDGASAGPKSQAATPHVATPHRKRLKAKKTTMDAETRDRVLQEEFGAFVAATPVTKPLAHWNQPWPNPQQLSVTKSQLDQHIDDFPDVEFINTSGIPMKKRRIIQSHMA